MGHGGKTPPQVQSYNSHTKPIYLEDVKYSRGQVNKYCKKCKDGAFELLENKKQTGKCCRCGNKFDSS